MLLRFNLLLLILVSVSLRALAQPKCAFDALHNRLVRSSPTYKARIDALETIIQSQAPRGISGGVQQEQTNVAQYIIPVVVHVVHTGDAVGTIYNPTDAQIQGAIAYMNQIYNGTLPGIQGVGDIEIQFQLATRDPNCSPTTGINRVNGSSLTNYVSEGVNVENTTGVDELAVKNLIRWDTQKYYNIWVVNRLDGQDGTSGLFYAGFAYFPGAPESLDGTIMLATQMAANKKTLPHELGHALDVYHPFEGSSGSTCPLSDGDCLVQGDRVCDTDPVTLSFTSRTGTNACTGTDYSINTENNFMGYGNLFTLFTAGQKTRMLAAAGSSPYRAYSGSWALSASYPINPFSAPGAASCSPVTGAAGLGGNAAGVMNLTLNGISVTSGNARGDVGYKNHSASCQRLFSLVEGQVYSGSYRLYGWNLEQAKVWIDFNNDGSFNNMEELVSSVVETSGTAQRLSGFTVPFTLNIPASAAKDVVLRMRILEDVSTVYGVSPLNTACANPVYGQAEDYPVLIRSLAAFPVKLLYFNGSAYGDEARLRWQTGEEQNFLRFDVERSASGVDYTKIGEVVTKGVPSAYQFNDPGLAPGQYQYRLKQVDRDGRFEYSRTVKVGIASPMSAFRILNNPADSYLDISMPLQRTALTARVMDMSGRVLIQQILPAGITRYRMQGVEKLSKGLYLVEVISGSSREVLKFIRQ